MPTLPEGNGDAVVIERFGTTVTLVDPLRIPDVVVLAVMVVEPVATPLMLTVIEFIPAGMFTLPGTFTTPVGLAVKVTGMLLCGVPPPTVNVMF